MSSQIRERQARERLSEGRAIAIFAFLARLSQQFPQENLREAPARMGKIVAGAE